MRFPMVNCIMHSNAKMELLRKRVRQQWYPISAMLKVPDGSFSWKWFKSLAQRSNLNLVGSTWSPM